MVTRPRRGDQVAPAGPRLGARSGCSTRPSACRAKRPASRGCTGSSVGHGHPPKPGTAVVGEGLLDARLVVHHERPVLRDRLTDRPALQHEHLGSRPPHWRSGGARRCARRRRPSSRARARRWPATLRRRRPCGRCRRLRWAGGSTRAPGSSTTCQMARSASGREAHELGGAGNGWRPASAPAMTVTSVVRPSRSLDDVARQVLVPEHREVGLDHLVGGREVEPDLEQLAGVGPVLVEEREHLAVDDAPPGGEPLHVAPAEAGGGTEGVGVVDVALPGEGHRLEAPVGVLGEPRDRAAVVHAPAVGAREVHAEVAGLQRGCRAHVLVGRGVVVEVVDAEEERVGGGPLEAEGDGLQHGVGHEGEATPGRCAGTGPTAGRAGRASG